MTLPITFQDYRCSVIRGTCGLLIAPLLFTPLFLRPTVLVQTTQTAQTRTHTFHDPTYHLSFDYPADWTFSGTDGEISTFHLDARSIQKKTSLRAVVAMPENPFPASTFSGAYVYFSVTPRSSAASCARQATPGARPTATSVNNVSFTRGHDEVKNICITQRDEIYTTYRRGSCYRFDLAINNFCGGEVSGVKDIASQELDQVGARLEAILFTFRFD